MFTGKFFEHGTDAKCFFRGCGSFGEIHGEIVRDKNSILQETENYKIECTYEIDEQGVCARNDVFTNISDENLKVSNLKSRFIFEGGEYQVYTQFCTWQSESRGMWQPLSTSVSVSGASSRIIQDGAPFLALWSEQEQRGFALHLLPNASWEMKVTRVGWGSKYTQIVVEAGIMDYNFDVTLAPGESIAMPEFICYEFRNKLDMDCWKLHNYMHTRYPRREMPVIYNTWMYCFDHIDCGKVSSQIRPAAELGVEYFVIDAGWFGKGKDWVNSVGDWKENTTGAFCGKMIEVAEKVRAEGMKFGLWIEPERAVPDSDSVKAHPEYYICGDAQPEFYFLDFANDEAREWIFNVICDLIEKYGVEYIKDDFNANIYFDTRHGSYLKYHEGHKKFIRAISEKYPTVYFSSCAGGGMRMELNNYKLFDSNWATDNENPYDAMDIYKESILRMPPQGFERWVAVHSLENFKPFYQSFAEYNQGNTERMISCGDAVWKNVVGVQPSFLDGYMTGGPIGISCDLSLISSEMKMHFKKFIADVKENRSFWKNAVARILCNTPSVTVLQYSDMSLSKLVVQLFTDHTQQDSFRIYPVVNDEKKYRAADGTVYSGKELADEGIMISSPKGQDNWNEMLEIILTEI